MSTTLRQPPRPIMELYGAGFNACNQLSFSKQDELSDPKDLYAFQPMLVGERVERPLSTLTYTLVRVNDELKIAGIGPEDSTRASLCAQAANGTTLEAHTSPSDGVTTIIQKSPFSGAHPDNTWQSPVSCKQIAAFDTGFVLLFVDGTVTSLGDPRFPECLGREVTESCPADVPNPITDLDVLNDPVKHVAASGYTVLALTESGSIYAWGRVISGAHRLTHSFPDLSACPNYIQVCDDEDIADVAIGTGHAIALSTSGHVFVIGSNSNGQLGINNQATAQATQWTIADVNVSTGYTITAIAAGPRSSFIIASKPS